MYQIWFYSNDFDFFQVVFEMQPRDAGAQAGGGATKEEMVWITIELHGWKNTNQY